VETKEEACVSVRVVPVLYPAIPKRHRRRQRSLARDACNSPAIVLEEIGGVLALALAVAFGAGVALSALHLS
jgi:hypothetical protein